MNGRRLLRIASGDITRWRADAIATSSNAGLCGNATPSFWRFRVRHEYAQNGGPVGCVPLDKGAPFANVDGQVHAAAGPELAAHLAEMVKARAFKLEGGNGPWRGSLLPRSTGGLVACPAGSAVRTPSFGALRRYTQTIVHVVAPDGRYASHWSAGAGQPLLRDAFTAAISQADEAGAASLAMPSVGCGVNGWSAPAAARTALEAVAAWAACDDADDGPSTLSRVDFVLRGAAELAAWRACAHERFGDVSIVDEEGHQCWTV